MKKTYKVLTLTICCIAFSLVSSPLFAQGRIPEWSKRYIGNDFDMITSSVEVSDGYILAGYSASGQGGDKSEPGRGRNDYWIIKTDKQGNKIWDKSFGGSGDDDLINVLPAADGGFLLLGSSGSDDGDKTDFNRGNYDYWVVKISSTGVKLWDKAYGGKGFDYLNSAIATKDGGFLLGGSSRSDADFEKSEDSRKGIDQSGNYNSTYDYWVIKINNDGTKLWDKTLGGEGDDQPYTLAEDKELNLYLAGSSSSGKGPDKSEASDIYKDNWIVKLNGNGEKIWDRIYGINERFERPIDMAVTPDNGLIVFQSIISYPGYEAHEPLIRIALSGNLLWEKVVLPKEGFDYSPYESYVEGTETEFYLLSSNRNSESNFITSLITYDWNGNVIHDRTLLIAPRRLPRAFLITSSGDILVNYYDYTTGVYDYIAATYYLTTTLRIEAEAYQNFTDVGLYGIAKISSSGFSGEKSTRIYDVGDRIKFSFATSTGNFRIKARVRSGAYSTTSSWTNPTSYWPNGYKFYIDGQAVVLKGINSTLSEKNSAYGGSYWGIIQSEVTALTEGVHTFEIESNKSFAGADYIEIVGAADSDVDPLPPVDFDKEIIAYPNPFINVINVDRTDKVKILAYSLTDSFGGTIQGGVNPDVEQRTLSLDVTELNLNPGTYFLFLETDKGNTNKTLIRK